MGGEMNEDMGPPADLTRALFGAFLTDFGVNMPVGGLSGRQEVAIGGGERPGQWTVYSPVGAYANRGGPDDPIEEVLRGLVIVFDGVQRALSSPAAFRSDGDNGLSVIFNNDGFPEDNVDLQPDYGFITVPMPFSDLDDRVKFSDFGAAGPSRRFPITFGLIDILNRTNDDDPESRDGVDGRLLSSGFGDDEVELPTGRIAEDLKYGVEDPLSTPFDGGPGDDFIYAAAGTSQRDQVIGGAGRDVIFGRAGDDVLWGDYYAADNLRLSAEDAPEGYALKGANASDTLFGGEGEDFLFGGIGGDNLTGGKHADRLFGDQGRDTIKGGEGDDLLFAGLKGDSAPDRLTGGGGKDQFFVGHGDQVADLQKGETVTVELSGRATGIALTPTRVVSNDTLWEQLFPRAESATAVIAYGRQPGDRTPVAQIRLDGKLDRSKLSWHVDNKRKYLTIGYDTEDGARASDDQLARRLAKAFAEDMLGIDRLLNREGVQLSPDNPKAFRAVDKYLARAVRKVPERKDDDFADIVEQVMTPIILHVVPGRGFGVEKKAASILTKVLTGGYTKTKPNGQREFDVDALTLDLVGFLPDVVTAIAPRLSPLAGVATGVVVASLKVIEKYSDIANEAVTDLIREDADRLDFVLTYNEIDGGPGADRRLTGTGDPDRIDGRGGADVISGRGARDELFGSAGEDVLRGDGGGDRLYGGRDNDTLKGGRQDDTLIGGAGADSLWGGAGADVFVLDPPSGGPADVIRDMAAIDRVAVARSGGLTKKSDLSIVTMDGGGTHLYFNEDLLLVSDNGLLLSQVVLFDG